VLVVDVTGSFTDQLTPTMGNGNICLRFDRRGRCTQWNQVVVRDSDVVTALRVLLDCMQASFTEESKLGLVAFTGYAQKYPVVVNGVSTDLPRIADGYANLATAANALRVCGTAGMPVCSGTNIGAGLHAANGIFAAGGPYQARSRKAIILISDGSPAASTSARVCPPPTGTGSCSDATLANWATATATAADNADTSIFTVFFNHGGSDTTGRNFLRSLVRGIGFASETSNAAQLSELTAAVCTALQMGHLVD
jgi:hypothetical protein